MKIKILIHLIVISFILPLTFIAQSDLQKQKHWYTGNQIGLPQYSHIVTYLNTFISHKNSNDSINNPHFVYGGFIGYQNNQHFSFELSYTWLGKTTYTNNEIHSSFKVQNVNISTKLNYPIINNNINIYSKFGGTIWHANVKNTCFNNSDAYYTNINDTNLSPLLGLGIEYKIRKNLKTRIEYQQINKIGNIHSLGAQSKHSLLSLNILYFL